MAEHTSAISFIGAKAYNHEKSSFSRRNEKDSEFKYRKEHTALRITNRSVWLSMLLNVKKSKSSFRSAIPRYFSKFE